MSSTLTTSSSPNPPSLLSKLKRIHWAENCPHTGRENDHADLARIVAGRGKGRLITYTHTPLMLVGVRIVQTAVGCQLLSSHGGKALLEPDKELGPWLTVLSFRVGIQTQEDTSETSPICYLGLPRSTSSLLFNHIS